jgi:hypothetical protein
MIDWEEGHGGVHGDEREKEERRMDEEIRAANIGAEMSSHQAIHVDANN